MSNYPHYHHVWKRLGVAVIDGEPQRRTTNKELAEKLGFKPDRRAVIWQIADNLMKQNYTGKKRRTKDREGESGVPGLYRRIYDERKAHERAEHPDYSLSHTHKMAHKYMSKIFVKHWFQAWRDQVRV